MGFLAPALPFIAKGLPLLGGLFGGGTQSKQAKQSVDHLGAAQELGFNLANRAQSMAHPFFSQASQYIPQGASYFQKLLSGNSNLMNEATLPERMNIADTFGSARNAIMAGPRGGGRTSALAQLPGQQAQATSGLLAQLRPQAATGLLGAGAQSGNMLTSLLNTATQGIYGTTGAANSLLNYDLQQQAAERERGRQIGSSIFDFVGSLPDLIKGTGGGKYKRNPVPAPSSVPITSASSYG